MTTIQWRISTAAALLFVSTASFAIEPDQRALELALSLSAQAPTVMEKSGVDQRAAAQAALVNEASKAQSTDTNAQQQGAK
ncbi:hypothetical protein H010_24739 [Hydrogenophaga taeniospiralis CCUG 15921]|uniref:DUF4398 domain-containing protein n=1 Tax=Hydrogenophaga taeniospiralis CCUG 15921 TaxID=1281780 RepID=A0A9X4P2G1_9BURK|nr:hypothetical protein [Hydrogenophaga taeniospiralis]MDG5978480.1 hypothetical protein [Hydrogenophaga taeniospiralis CCUG 15921]